MKILYKIIMILLLLPSLGFGQVVISGIGEIVATGTADIVLTGDWTNNSSAGDGAGFTASTGAGSVIFKGTSAQSLGGSNLYTSFHNLNLDNSSGLTLVHHTLIKNLTFTNGILTSASATGLYIVDGGSVTGASNDRFVNGPMIKAGGTPFKFDIGKGLKYAPLSISGLSGSAYIEAEYIHSQDINYSNFALPLVKISDIEHWLIDDITGGQFPVAPIDAKIEIFWQNADESGIKTLDNTLQFARYYSSEWHAEGTNISGTSSLGSGSGSISSTSVFKLDYQNVTFGTTNNVSNPLPIQLLSFTAQCQKQDVVLNWSTASEENNAYFTLLRSEDAEHYEEIAQISGAGNSNEIINYSFSDWNAANGTYYYMLKQTDYNGQSESFAPVYVNCNQEKEVSLKMLYDGDNAYALLSNAQSGSYYNMMIIDHTGRILIQEKQNVNTQNYYRIPKEQLASGLYSIIYFTDDGTVRLNEKVFIR